MTVNNYYDFLMNLVGANPDTYLFRYLYKVNYIWTIPLDKNRAQDGIDLRCLYANLYHLSADEYNVIFGNEPCSVLEMLIAFAIRIENDFMASAEGDRTSTWFEMMIRNLFGDSDDLKTKNSRGKIDHALLAFFNHEISPFPIPEMQISNMQLWDQLNYWLMKEEKL